MSNKRNVAFICFVFLIALGCGMEPASERRVIVDTTKGERQVITALPGDIVSFDGFELSVPDEIGAGVALFVNDGEQGQSVELVYAGEGKATVFGQTTSTRLLSAKKDAPHPFDVQEVAEQDVAEQDVDDERGQDIVYTPSNINDECLDDAHKHWTLSRPRWDRTLEFYIATAGMPSQYQVRHLENRILDGLYNLVTYRNDCGIFRNPVYPEATNNYRSVQTLPSGPTAFKYLGRNNSRMPGISLTTRCTGRDGRNVVGFGAMVSAKAAACVYWNGSQVMTEGDILFNSQTDWIPSRFVPNDCVDSLHLESVATHEWGHIFGLAHPDGNHPTLTMQAGGSCDKSKQRLGLGDILGLRKLYPNTLP